MTEELLANQDEDDYVEEIDKGDLIETISQSTKLKFKRTFSIMRKSERLERRESTDPLETFTEHDDYKESVTK